MTNNDILRRLRFGFEFNDKKMQELFALADLNVDIDLLKAWLKKDDDPEFKSLTDVNFATFLNGLIYNNRGKQAGKERAPEKRLSNNIILNKLKIALNLKAEDIIEMLALSEFSVSKHELSAMFRKPDHKHYKECKDQILRNFINGIQKKYRKSPIRPSQPAEKTPESNTTTVKRSAPDSRTAKPKASEIYINPKATPSDKQTTRKVLKISPSEIWKNS